jgi:hypothetical protein
MLGFAHKIEPVEVTLPRLLGHGLPGCARPPVKGHPPKIHFSAGLFPTASASVHLSSDRALFAPPWRFLVVRWTPPSPRNNIRAADNAHKRSAPFFHHQVGGNKYFLVLPLVPLVPLLPPSFPSPNHPSTPPTTSTATNAFIIRTSSSHNCHPPSIHLTSQRVELTVRFTLDISPHSFVNRPGRCSAESRRTCLVAECAIVKGADIVAPLSPHQNNVTNVPSPELLQTSYSTSHTDDL